MAVVVESLVIHSVPLRSPHTASSGPKVVVAVVFVEHTYLGHWPGIGSCEGLICPVHETMN